MSNIIEIVNISKEFIIQKTPFEKPSRIKALNKISFSIESGSIFGLIGESGSGKSTLGKIVTNLMMPDKGEVRFHGQNLFDIEEKEMRKLRKDIQIVFQMAQNPLDPKRSVEELLSEPLNIHLKLQQSDIIIKINELLKQVGLDEVYKDKLPFQLSGGQRQRVIIARAIASNPKFLVLDEPVSALDVSMQGQIMNLLIDLKKEMSLTYLFITHDLYLARKFCTHIGVMKDGELVEIGKIDDVMNHPKNAYTQQLINSFK
ncbi:MAG: ABC transporter ATP-binding protein [Clostridiales bacterium]|nr:ABC transporter ATP-binding protein [Clostridiales bacterium]